MVSIFFLSLIGFKIKGFVDLKQQKMVVDLYILSALLVLKLVIFIYDNEIYYQINKKEIKKLEKIKIDTAYKPYIEINNAKINIAYSVEKSIESLIILKAIDYLIGIIRVSNENIILNNLKICSGPIEEREMKINMKIVIHLEIFKMIFINLRRLWKANQLKN